MEFLTNVIDFLFQHPVWAIVAAVLVVWILAGIAMAASDSSGSSGGGGGGGSSYSSPSTYTSQMTQTGTAARQQMDRTSDAYRSRVRDTLRR